MLLLEPSFKYVINELKTTEIMLPNNPANIEVDMKEFIFPPNGQLVTSINDIKKESLNAEKGEKYLQKNCNICAYDESLLKYSCLEGSAFLTSHSLVTHNNDKYIPTGLLSFYFYTRSESIVKNSNYIKYSKNPELDSKKDYVKDKIDFLTKYVPNGSLLLIDGPLIGGDVYTYMIRAIESFIEKDIIPIFFVKNSTSNLVTDNVPEFAGKYNSDLHWAYNFLRRGERSNYFLYTDTVNNNNAKVFTYIRALDGSPQRVEFHKDTFYNHKDVIDEIMNLIYYLLIVQGDGRNPQVRPIAIAEKYAREYIKVVDINKYLYESVLVPTINQERFGW